MEPSGSHGRFDKKRDSIGVVKRKSLRKIG